MRRRGSDAWIESLLVALNKPMVMIRWEPGDAPTDFAASWLVHADRAEVQGDRLVASLDGQTFAFELQEDRRATLEAGSGWQWSWRVMPLESQRWAVRLEVRRPKGDEASQPSDSETPQERSFDAAPLTLYILEDVQEPSLFEREVVAWKKLVHRSTVEALSISTPTGAAVQLAEERLRFIVHPPTSMGPGELEALLGHGLFEDATRLVLDLLDHAEEDSSGAAGEKAAAAADAVVRWTGDPHPFLARRGDWENLLDLHPPNADRESMVSALASMAESVVSDWPTRTPGAQRATTEVVPQPADEPTGKRLPVLTGVQPENGKRETRHPPEGAEREPLWVAQALAAVLGLRPDAAYGRIELAPDCSDLRESLRIENLRVGGASLALEVTGKEGEIEIRVTQTAGAVPLMAILRPILSGPITGVFLDGVPREITAKPIGTHGPDRWQIEIQVPLDGDRSLRLLQSDG